MNRKIKIVRFSIAALLIVYGIIVLSQKQISKITFIDFIPVTVLLLVTGFHEIKVFFHFKNSKGKVPVLKKVN
jgi:hypothetical protein